MAEKQYIIKDELSKGPFFVVNNAENSKTGEKCVIKSLVEEYPRPEHIAAIKYEYELLKKLNINNVIKPLELTIIKGNPALVEESIGGRSVRFWMDQQAIELKDVLHIVIEVVKALEELHAHHIIHKDINPSNIIWNPRSGAVKLIDFNSASELPEENLEVTGISELEGTIAYISPEQTGRISRGLNYRTDFYSLGITFFEMVTGKLPFQTSDPLEMVHFHIAKEPPSASEVNHKVPKVISKIIQKCMKKSAEERYQTGFGILQDLNHCLESLQKTGSVKEFEIAAADAHDQLYFSGKLYGRENEIQQLLDVFEIAKKGAAQLLMVAGYSGVGKTAIVSEMRNHVAESMGYFLHGKSDQFNKNIPYFPLIEAIRQLIQKVLVSGEKEINDWKVRILKAVGNNGRIVTGMIPILEKIIGEQPAVPDLNPAENQARTEYTLTNFMLALSSSQRPLAIFIDDLQWADTPLLNLIQEIFRREDFKHTMLIGAYRSNEVDDIHPLMLTLKKIGNSDLQIGSIELKPLEEKYVHQWIAAVLHDTEEQTSQLSEIIFQKTNGNAFFIIQLLKELKTKNELIFSFEKKCWIWNIDTLKQLNITDNVVDLMVEKIQRLSPAGLRQMQIASCIGNRFDLRLLAIVNKSTVTQAIIEMQELLQAGFILPIDDSYKYFIEDGDDPIMMRFLHDRMQQAGHSTIDKAMKKQIHYEIGWLLNQKLKEDLLLEVVEHLNYGSELIKSDSEKLELIKLNLRAGQKAIKSNAYDFALKVLDFAIKLLPADSWVLLPELCEALFLETAQAALLSFNQEKTTALLEQIIQSSKNRLTIQKAYKLKTISLITWNQYDLLPEAVREAFQHAGITIKVDPDNADVDQAIAEVFSTLAGKPISILESLPPLKNHQIGELIATVSIALGPLFNYNLPLGTLLSAMGIKLSIQYGNCIYSAHCYTDLALALVPRNEDAAIQFSSVAFNNPGKAVVIHTSLIVLTWLKPFRNCLDLLMEGYQWAIGLGEFEGACWCLYGYSQISFLSGINLDECYKISNQASKRIKNLNAKLIYYYNEAYRQTIENLMKKKANRTEIIYESFDTTSKNESLRHQINRKILEIQLCYIFEELAEGKRNSDIVRELLPKTFYTATTNIHFIFRALTLIGLHPTLPSDSQAKSMEEIEELLKMIGLWQSKNRANVQHFCLLCQAEKSRLDGDYQKAEPLYLESIQRARQDGFQHVEAIALEALGRFYHQVNDKEKEKETIIKAHDAYRRWGALAKTEEMENKYREFFLTASVDKQVEITSSLSTRSLHGISEKLDLASAMKAVSVISEEIQLDRLIPKMLGVMIENAGAQKAYLLEKKKLGWEVAAKMSVESGKEDFHLISQPLEQSADLPLQIIQYVQKSNEAVVLADAVHDEQFDKDPYIQKIGAKSILCMPINQKEKMIAIVLFENHLQTHVFTPDRIQILRILGTQAAISLENARLFERMIILNSKTHRFVPTAFLKMINKESVEDVVLGDSVKKNITVLFNDIRSFTTLVESRTPEDAFAFVNRYWDFMAPVIRQHDGYIDQYLGDAVMAIFPNKPDDAIHGAISMMQALEQFNEAQIKIGDVPIHMGIGISTGPAMLGIIGEKERHVAGLISDVANTASRIEGLNKLYGSRILVSGTTANAISLPEEIAMRKVDRVRLKGKTTATEVFEVIEWSNKLQSITLKEYLKLFNIAFGNYLAGRFEEAKEELIRCLEHYPQDKAAIVLLERCVEFLKQGAPQDWDGTYIMLHK